MALRGVDGVESLVVLLVAVLALGWAVMPLFFPGGDETLDPTRLVMLPLRPRPLVRALLVASLVGIGPLFTVCLLVGSVFAVLFAGSLVPRVILEEARQVTVPLHVLLQRDDQGNDREASLALFDAFASPDKSLHAHLGGHSGVPAHAGDAAAEFFARHLRAG
ncbi:hypothetical protein STENM223S_02913 [Streptomyces tendae]